MLVALRPTSITLHRHAPDDSSARNVWPATVSGLAPLGDRVRVTADGEFTATTDVTAAAVAELGLAPGEQVWLSAKATDLTVYPAPLTSGTLDGCPPSPSATGPAPNAPPGSSARN